MSTRSVIARQAGDGFIGRYHHSDGYPSGVGAAIYKLYNGYFKQDAKRMLEVLIDEHPAGWSTIVGSGLGEVTDFSKAIGFHESDVNEQKALMTIADMSTKLFYTVRLDGPEPSWQYIERTLAGEEDQDE